MAKKYLTKDDILKAEDIETREVEVPEWGGIVLVRGLTANERDKLESDTLDQRGKKVTMNLERIRARMVAASVVDENGKKMFTPADVTKLGEKSAVALDRVFEVAQELSGMSAKDVEELTKNSSAARSESSLSS